MILWVCYDLTFLILLGWKSLKTAQIAIVQTPKGSPSKSRFIRASDLKAHARFLVLWICKRKKVLHRATWNMNCVMSRNMQTKFTKHSTEWYDLKTTVIVAITTVDSWNPAPVHSSKVVQENRPPAISTLSHQASHKRYQCISLYMINIMTGQPTPPNVPPPEIRPY